MCNSGNDPADGYWTDVIREVEVGLVCQFSLLKKTDCCSPRDEIFRSRMSFHHGFSFLAIEKHIRFDHGF